MRFCWDFPPRLWEIRLGMGVSRRPEGRGTRYGSSPLEGAWTPFPGPLDTPPLFTHWEDDGAGAREGIAYDASAHRHLMPSADGEGRLHAAVKEVRKQLSGELALSGILFNSGDPSERRGTFEARGVPHEWNRRDAWALRFLACLLDD